MPTCDKCAAFGPRFNRAYAAHEFVEGDPTSPIWIVGLNPAQAEDWNDPRTTKQLDEGFADHARENTSFAKFEQVSHWLYGKLGARGGVAHTDLVKCSSPSWPPPSCQRRNVERVTENCGPYLLQQIRLYRPRLITGRRCAGS
jgi:uracil-DNA glycosylase